MAETVTAAATRPTASPREPSPYRATFARVLQSEWVRLTTTRSTWITLLATGVVMGVVGAVAAAASTGSVEGPGGAPPPGFDGADGIGVLMAGQTPGVLVIGVLGVMLGAREYASGMVRTTYAAVPRRLPVLLARAIVLAASSAVVIGAGVAVALLAGNAVLVANDADTVALGDDGTVRVLVGVTAYLVGTGVLGVLLGTLARGLGLGIGVFVGLVLVLPGFGTLLLPDDWQDALDYLPSQAAESFTTVAGGGLTTATGTAVFLGWLVALGAAAATTLARRDV